MTELLRDFPLAANQRIDDEPAASAFDAKVQVKLPASGQLLRWLLGFGDNIEVLAPADLRQVMKAQTAKAAALYRGR